MSSKLFKTVCVLIPLFLVLVFVILFNRADDPSNTTSSGKTTTTSSGKTTTTPSGNSTTISTASTTTTSTSTTATTTATTTTKRITTTPRSTTTGTANSTLKKKVLSVPILAQFPDYPTGCESVSAVMALRYYGESIDVGTFIDKHLPMDNSFKTINGVLYGPNPYKHFVGNPVTSSSYGCMAPVIEKALTSYFGSNQRVINTTGTSLSALCSQYIDNGEPVLVWATIGMIETGKGPGWKLEDGSTFYWPLNEHCMVLIGYDENRYYFADPYRGMVKSYARWLCESRYKDIGMQSIAITK